jgi:hypothetical protein
MFSGCRPNSLYILADDSDSAFPYCASFILDLKTALYTHFGCETDAIRTVSIEPSASAAVSSAAAVSSTATSSTPTPSPVPQSKSNAGAIVGGVVGGVAILGLAIGGTILYLKKRKQKQRITAMAEVQT